MGTLLTSIYLLDITLENPFSCPFKSRVQVLGLVRATYILFVAQ